MTKLVKVNDAVSFSKPWFGNLHSVAQIHKDLTFHIDRKYTSHVFPVPSEYLLNC